MKLCYECFLACVNYYEAFRESIDQFDEENNIVDLDDVLKAKKAKRLQEVEDEINADNEKYDKGEASSGMKLYAWSDLSKEEIEAQKMGLSTDLDPSRGDRCSTRKGNGTHNVTRV